MTKTVLQSILAICVLFSLTTGAFAQNSNPVTWSVESQDLGSGSVELTFTASIEKGWHMYDMGNYGEYGPTPTSIKFTPNNAYSTNGEMVTITAPVKKFDPIFELEIGYFDSIAVFKQKVNLLMKTNSAPQTINGVIEWMCCDDKSCTPPAEYDFAVEVSSSGVASASVAQSADNIDGAGGSSLWATIIEAILWGLAALLTPCVFPMVPMTVSLFMKNEGGAARGRFMALMYGLFIVALYTIPIAIIILVTRVVGGDAITADIFNWLATHWIPNVLFFLVFMVFAASFFGAFEITMPSWLVNRSDSKASKGGLGGVFFMALTLVLVSFSCTGPIVGSVLIKSTAGEFWEPIITMLAFSASFAIPFVVFAMFPALLKNLPKSGGWLNSVKVVLGFIEVALGLKFLSVADQTYHWGLLDRETYLAIWIVVFALLGTYLLGKIKFAHDSDTKHVSVTRLFLAMGVFSFVVYLVPGMFGAPLKGLSGYLPPMHTQDFVIGGLGGSSAGNSAAGNSSSSSDDPSTGKIKYSDFLSLPYGLNGFFEYNQALAYAKQVGKPLFLDFTGHGCVNCREMEAKVWSDPDVLALLRDKFVIVALYSDDKKVLPESDWVTTHSGKTLKSLGKINSYIANSKFGVNAQPYYMILDGQGQQLVPARGYNLDAQAFAQFLKNGLKAYQNADK